MLTKDTRHNMVIFKIEVNTVRGVGELLIERPGVAVAASLARVDPDAMGVSQAVRLLPPVQVKVCPARCMRHVVAYQHQHLARRGPLAPAELLRYT